MVSVNAFRLRGALSVITPTLLAPSTEYSTSAPSATDEDVVVQFLLLLKVVFVISIPNIPARPCCNRKSEAGFALFAKYVLVVLVLVVLVVVIVVVVLVLLSIVATSDSMPAAASL